MSTTSPEAQPTEARTPRPAWQRFTVLGEALWRRRPRVAMPRPRRSGPPPAALVLLGMLLALAAWVALNTLVLAPRTQPWAFALPWAGLRAWLFHGASPYDRTAMRPLLAWLSGRPPDLALPPFPFLLLYLPWALIPSGPWAYGLWLTLQQGAMAWAVMGLTRRMRNRVRAWGVLFGLMLLWPGTWLVWQQGAAEALALPLALMAWQAFYEGQDRLAGWLWLPGLWVLDRMAWPLVGWGMWALSRGRRQGPVAWMSGVAGLTALAYWLRPGWLAEYLAQPGPPPAFPALREALLSLMPGLNPRVALTLALFAVLSMVVYWGRAWIGGFAMAYWTGMWSLTLALWLAFRVESSGLFWLLPAWIFVFATWLQGWRYGGQATAWTALLLWGGAWAGLRLLPEPRLAALVLAVGVPVAMFLLSWSRWWYFRPLRGLWS